MIAVVLGAMLLESAVVAGIPPSRDGEKLTIVNGFAFVDVSIGGKGPFRMMIDTGATSCSLSPESAKAAGLVMDYRVVFPYLIDYRQKLLWLGDEAVRQAASLRTEIAAERADGRMVLPVGMESGGGRWRLTLDTGANALVIRCGARCPKLRDAHGGDRIVTNAGSCAVRRGIVHHVTVGTMIIPRAEAALVDGPVRASEDGVLPASWFSAVYVDSARNLVRLRW